MSYSPARIEETAKPEAVDAEAASQANVEAPVPSWFGEEPRCCGAFGLAAAVSAFPNIAIIRQIGR